MTNTLDHLSRPVTGVLYFESFPGLMTKVTVAVPLRVFYGLIQLTVSIRKINLTWRYTKTLSSQEKWIRQIQPNERNFSKEPPIIKESCWSERPTRSPFS